jgi:hypothetical protein
MREKGVCVLCIAIPDALYGSVLFYSGKSSSFFLFYIPPFLYTHGGCVYKKYQRLRDEGLLCVLFFYCVVAKEKQTVLESFLSMRPRWLKNIAVHNIYNGIVEIVHRQGKKRKKIRK